MTPLEQDYRLIGQIMARMIIRKNQKSTKTGKLCQHGMNLLHCIPLLNTEYNNRFGCDLYEDYFRVGKERIQSMKAEGLVHNRIDPKFMTGYYESVTKLYQDSQGFWLIDIAPKVSLKSLDLLTDDMCKAIDLICLRWGHLGTWGWFQGEEKVGICQSYVGSDEHWEWSQNLTNKEYEEYYKESSKSIAYMIALMNGDIPPNTRKRDNNPIDNSV